MRILCVAAAGPDSAYLVKALGESSHSVDTAENVDDGAHLAAVEAYDAVIVLGPAADHTGPQAIRKFSNRPAATPLLVIVRPNINQDSNRDSKDDRVRALKAGADACFAVPYSFAELEARLHALARRTTVAAAATALTTTVMAAITATVTTAMTAAVATTATAAGGLHCDVAGRRIYWGKHHLTLPRREYLLLECLLRRPGQVVTALELLRYIWGDETEADAKSLGVVLSRLRRQLTGMQDAVLIETVAGHGYRLIQQPAGNLP